VAISQKLDLKQGQQLVMTPQLQQAIKLLQLTNLELQEFVESQLLENPFLERDERDNGPQRGDGAKHDESGDQSSAGESELTFQDGAVAEASTNLDSDYDSVDPNASAADKQEAQRNDLGPSDWSTPSSGGGNFEDLNMEANLTREKSLQEVLTEQLHIATGNEVDLLIGHFLIDLIDESGYFRSSTDAVAARLGTSGTDIERVLGIIQQFEPAGVGARNLQECLKLQLQDQDRLDPAMESFMEHLHLIGAADLAGLKRATKLSEDDIKTMITEIKALNPKPGLAFGHENVQIVVPDVYVGQADDGGWKVELNTDTLPKVLANQKYFAKLSADCTLDEDKSYLSEQMSNANWLVKSLDQRARTILKVASEIVRQQDSFFVYGVKHLRPLNLRAVADAISMHESTVSRVTSNKYIATTRGVFEMKYFFTSAIGATTGDVAHSAEAVRFRIKELIDAEEPKAILSDDRLVELLKVENIVIARRTVAKYREAMGIPSSVQRRREKQKAI
jgi:RNA polymerase sigma-54 factor